MMCINELVWARMDLPSLTLSRRGRGAVSHASELFGSWDVEHAAVEAWNCLFFFRERPPGQLLPELSGQAVEHPYAAFAALPSRLVPSECTSENWKNWEINRKSQRKSIALLFFIQNLSFK
jgi:hypothetical protein